MNSSIIAEAGVNHNGSLDLAIEMVNVAAETGADVVKFQSFDANSLVTKAAPKAEYQKATTSASESQFQMLQRLELDGASTKRVARECEVANIEFMSSAFDENNLAFLRDEIGVSRLKIPSGELTNAPLCLLHAKSELPLLLSTGMATLGEIERILGVIAFGYIAGSGEKPCLQGFKAAYRSDDGQQAIQQRVTLLHCTSEYPAPPKSVNLSNINTLHSTFSLPVGYSDHSEGVEIPIAAMALGATIIEKHFTLDKAMEGPDHSASADPSELNRLVCAREVLAHALGSHIRRPSDAELANARVVRKSIVAKSLIKIGEQFSPDNLTMKRPGTGKPPHLYWELLGTKAERNYEPDEQI